MLWAESAAAVSDGGCSGGRVCYHRREPEYTVLHQLVRENLASFLTEAAERYPSGELPHFIQGEFECYLNCGILEHSFARSIRVLQLIRETLASNFLLAPTATTFLEERILLREGEWWQAYFVVDAPNRFNVPIRQKLCVEHQQKGRSFGVSNVGSKRIATQMMLIYLERRESSANG